MTAVAATIFPQAALLAGLSQAALTFAFDKYARRAQEVIEAETARLNLASLSVEQQAAFVPMVVRYFEAARQGEYEHTLEVLAAFIAGEMKKDEPKPGHVARMARRIEGLSKRDLKVIALMNDLANRPPPNPPPIPSKGGISVMDVLTSFSEAGEMGFAAVWESLSELSNRSLLLMTHVSGYGVSEGVFVTTEAFRDLIENAETKFARGEAESETP
ncbi:hypothetical protein K9U39_03910 [Rhodoblastus acidophilus]|nr:hypothetical protein [Rhodoblastus acidophilus]